MLFIAMLILTTSLIFSCTASTIRGMLKYSFNKLALLRQILVKGLRPLGPGVKRIAYAEEIAAANRDEILGLDSG